MTIRVCVECREYLIYDTFTGHWRDETRGETYCGAVGGFHEPGTHHD